jgi:hypothetical protein
MLLNQLLWMPFIYCILLCFIRFQIFIAETKVQCQGNACGISVRVLLEHFFFSLVFACFYSCYIFMHHQSCMSSQCNMITSVGNWGCLVWFLDGLRMKKYNLQFSLEKWSVTVTVCMRMCDGVLGYFSKAYYEQFCSHFLWVWNIFLKMKLIARSKCTCFHILLPNWRNWT